MHRVPRSSPLLARAGQLAHDPICSLKLTSFLTMPARVDREVHATAEQELGATTRESRLPRRQAPYLFPSPQLGSLHGIAHQHGDRQRPDAARHGRDRSRNLGHFGMDVAHQR